MSYENAVHAEIVRVSIESGTGTLMKKKKKYHNWYVRGFFLLKIFAMKISQKTSVAYSIRSTSFEYNGSRVAAEEGDRFYLLAPDKNQQLKIEVYKVRFNFDNNL